MTWFVCLCVCVSVCVCVCVEWRLHGRACWTTLMMGSYPPHCRSPWTWNSLNRELLPYHLLWVISETLCVFHCFCVFTFIPHTSHYSEVKNIWVVLVLESVPHLTFCNRNLICGHTYTQVSILSHEDISIAGEKFKSYLYKINLPDGEWWDRLLCVGEIRSKAFGKL